MIETTSAVEAERRKRLVAEWEGMCDPSKGCRTACCHWNGSPCEKLKIMDHKTGAGVCTIYHKRYGERKTVAGEQFRCGTIREWLMTKPAPEKCGYLAVGSIEGVPVVRGKP